MPSLSLSFYIGACLSFIAALFCALRGDKYVAEIDRVNLEISSSNDPQEASSENVKEEPAIQKEEEGLA
jgi:hypothetical protein